MKRASPTKFEFIRPIFEKFKLGASWQSLTLKKSTCASEWSEWSINAQHYQHCEWILHLQKRMIETRSPACLAREPSSYKPEMSMDVITIWMKIQRVFLNLDRFWTVKKLRAGFGSNLDPWRIVGWLHGSLSAKEIEYSSAICPDQIVGLNEEVTT